MNEEIPNFQADFLTFLASTKEVEISKLYTFAIDSLIFADKVHTFHWKCESGFQHTHFEAIYDDIRDFADALVETVLSMGVKFKAESKTYTITDDLFDVSNALLKIEAYRDTIIDLKSQYSTKISLENLFGDIIEKLDKELGLIKNFK
jgi:DNA-binding ferritin-like protein